MVNCIPDKITSIENSQMKCNHSSNMHMIYYFIFSFFILVSTSDDLRCYECDPSSAGNCTDVVKHDNKKVICNHVSTQKIELDHKPKISVRTGTIPPKKHECIHFVVTETNEVIATGEHRGCIQKDPKIESYCNHIMNNSTFQIKECESCPTDDCNNNKIKTGSSSANLYFIIYYHFIHIFVIITFVR